MIPLNQECKVRIFPEIIDGKEIDKQNQPVPELILNTAYLGKLVEQEKPKPPKSNHELKSEEEYIKILESAEQEKSYLKIVETLEKLGQLYFLKNDFTVACRMFNAAIALNDTYSQDSSMKQFLMHCLVKVEAMYIKKVLGELPKNFSYEVAINKIIDHRDWLALHRCTGDEKEILDEHQNMQVILATITQSRIQLTQDLITECFSLLGNPPCQYAFVSMGSMSRKEASHFSDLEFAILIEVDSDQNRDYFRHLTHLLELKVMNLGETPFNILQHGLDSPTPSGFCFDSGGNSPIGKKGLFELIGTPDQMANFLTTDWFERDLIMCNAISNLDMILGEEKLLADYEKKACIILNQIITKQNPSLTVRQQRALLLIKGDLLEFSPKLDEKKAKLRVFDIKKELYRLPNSVLNALALFYGLRSKNSWERIAEMEIKGLLSVEGARQFVWVFNEITKFRVKTHLHYRSENEKVFYEPQSRYERYQWQVGNYYVLKDSDQKNIALIFQVLFAIYDAAKEFYETNGQVNPFQSSKLINDTSVDHATALYHAGDYLGAKEAWIKIIALDPKNLEALYHLAYIFSRLSLYSQAIEYYKKFLNYFEFGLKNTAVEDLSKKKYIYNIVGFYIKVLTDLSSLVVIRNPEEGFSYVKLALEFYHKHALENPAILVDIYLMASQVFVHMKQYIQAIRYLENVRKICTSIRADKNDPIKEKINLLFDIDISLSCALSTLGYIHIQIGDYNTAIDCLKDAIVLAGDNCGSRLLFLGNALFLSGKIEEGIHTLKQALSTQEKIYGKVHPEVARTLSHLANTYHEIKDYKNALFSWKQELYVNQALYGTWNKSNLTRWRRLGTIAQENKCYEEALLYHKAELEVAIKCFGPKSVYLSSIYYNISFIEYSLSHYEKSIQWTEKALALHKERDQNYTRILSLLQIALLEVDPKRAIKVNLESIAILRELVERDDPQLAINLSNLGHIYKKIGDIKQAISCFQESYTIFVKALGPYHPRTNQALERLMELLPQDTTNRRVDLMTAILKAWSSDQSLASPVSYLAVPEDFPYEDSDEIQFLQLQAERQLKEGKLLQAISTLEYVIKKDQKNKRAYFILGEIFREQKKYRKAEELSVILLSLAPEHPIVHYQLGHILFLQNQLQRAKIHLEKSCTFDPQNQDALKLLQQIDELDIQEETGLLVKETKNVADSEELFFISDIELEDKAEKDDHFYLILNEIIKGNITKLEGLYPFDVNLTNKAGLSFLHFAVNYSLFDVMVFLCEHGANVNLTNDTGISPIFYTISQWPFFHYLVSKGARLDLKEKKFGNTLLHHCAFKGDIKMSKYLLKTKKILIDSANHLGLTPLHIACQEEKIEYIKFLLDHGADIRKQEKRFHCSSIGIAIICNHLSVLSLLLDYYPDSIAEIRNQESLFLAIKYQRLDCIRFLCQKFPQILEISNEEGETPLSFASSNGVQEAASLLIELGAKQACQTTTSANTSDEEFLEQFNIDGQVITIMSKAQYARYLKFHPEEFQNDMIKLSSSSEENSQTESLSRSTQTNNHNTQRSTHLNCSNLSEVTPLANFIREEDSDICCCFCM